MLHYRHRFNAMAMTVLRKDKGWSMRYLASVSGISFQQISQLESGKRQDPKFTTFMALCEALDAKPEDLMFELDFLPPGPPPKIDLSNYRKKQSYSRLRRKAAGLKD